MIVSLLLFLVVLASLAAAAFCAGAETGFLSVRRGRVLHMAREGGARAKVVYEAISDMGRTTTALLVGNNLASVTYSSAATALSLRLFADSSFAQVVSSLVVALALLMLGEFLPKLFCSARPLRRLLWLVPCWKVFAKVFVPVGSLVQAVIGRLLPRRETKAKVTPESLLKLLQDRKDGVRLSDFESALIARILVLRARGEFVIPESLLPVLDDGVL